MNISFSFVSDTVTNGLSQSEINSFKWGNSPSEDAIIKGCIRNLLPHAKYSLYGSGYDYNNKPIKRHYATIVSLLQKWVNECEDIEALESMTEKICGVA